MKAQKILLLLIALLLSAGGGSAWAGGRVYGGVGVYIGPGGYWGPGYARPYYYPRPYYPGFYPYPYGPYYDEAPVVVVPSAPPVYIEQSDAVAEQAPDNTQYWYYCRSARNYYPYVKECPGGWQKVPPRPAQ